MRTASATSSTPYIAPTRVLTLLKAVEPSVTIAPRPPRVTSDGR
jgi:hypothetical protein